MPDGSVSGYVSDNLRIGAQINLTGPFGNSYLRDQHEGPIVAVAGGTGLAPILSIVRAALGKASNRRVHLYFGVQDEPDIYAELQLQRLALSYPNMSVDIVLSAPSQSSYRRKGYVHSALAQDFGDLAGAKIYSAGPSPMIDAVSKVGVSLGVDLDDIHSDAFTASSIPKKKSLFDLFRRRQ